MSFKFGYNDRVIRLLRTVVAMKTNVLLPVAILALALPVSATDTLSFDGGGYSLLVIVATDSPG